MLAFSYPDHCQISYIEPLLSRQLLLPSFLPKNLSCISSVRSIFQELLVLYDTRPSGWQLLLKNNLLQPSPANRSLQTRENQYKQILRYIQEHYDRKIYLEDLASSLDMNPQYFCRFFKKQFQMTPMTYINYYRTLQAADLLRHSSLSVLEVGLRTGFENPSYFAKTFRKYYNCSPAEYRKLSAF